MKKTYIKPIHIACLLTTVLLSSCNDHKPKETTKTKKTFCLDDNFKSKVEWTQAEIKPISESIHLTGSVEPNPDNVVHYVSLVSGIISNTNFSLGDQVTKGQVLAELRSADLSELQSQSQTISAQIRVAEKKLQSVQSMYEDGISSQKELTEAQSELDILKAEKEKTAVNLRLFSANTEKGVFQIKSPATGIITAKSISAGTQISAEGEPLFTVSDLTEVWILANIYATNIQHVQTEMEVSIETLSYPDESFKGKITSISQVLDAEAKVLKARIVLQNKDFKLKPGMLVDVTALKHTDQEALSIPKSAIVFDNNQNYVVTYNDDCNLNIKPIEILSNNSKNSFISGGLNDSEKIISKNQLLIYEQIKNFQN